MRVVKSKTVFQNVISNYKLLRSQFYLPQRHPYSPNCCKSIQPHVAWFRKASLITVLVPTFFELPQEKGIFASDIAVFSMHNVSSCLSLLRSRVNQFVK